MDHRGGEIEVCGEALVGFVGAQARMATPVQGGDKPGQWSGGMVLTRAE
jgi:hypothetical protein